MEENKDQSVVVLRDLIAKLRHTLKEAEDVVSSLAGDEDIDFSTLVRERAEERAGEHGGEVVEGVFNGVEFVGRDGKTYAVPQNYASKSKLVEGDLLKLTITPTGSFIYKQIGPVERERLRGKLAQEKESDEYVATVGDRLYKLLLASVTYFHGDVGDDVVLLVPRGGKARWAAVENVIKK